jgi:hypothetical protein
MFMLYFLTITGEVSKGQIMPSNRLKHLWPALAILIPFVLFMCPCDELTNICFGVRKNGFKQRFGLMKEIGAVLVSPLSRVTFLRSFIADIFCSMPRIFTDLQYTICIYATGTFADTANEAEEIMNKRQHSYYVCGAGNPPFYVLQVALSLFPYYLRLCQSLRAYVDTGEFKHMGNALKYSMSLLVTGLSTTISSMDASNPMKGSLQTAWIVAGISTTIYAFYWDVAMDW